MTGCFFAEILASSARMTVRKECENASFLLPNGKLRKIFFTKKRSGEGAFFVIAFML
jgi:hypothetical protein